MARRGESKKGQYYRPHPLDFELLRRMPREGTTLGFHTLAMTVAHVKKELNKTAPTEESKLTGDQIASRLNSMKFAGYVVNVKIVAGSGWQRTLKGEKHYAEHVGEAVTDSVPELEVIEGGRR